MKKVASVFVLFSVSVLISACGGSGHEAQIVQKAPKNQAEINDSLIVMGLSEDEHLKLLEENPQALSRKLTKDTFEIRGASKQSIIEISPESIIEKNYFIKAKTNKPTKEEILKEVFKNKDAAEEFSQKNCVREPFLRVPDFNILTRTGVAEAGKLMRLQTIKTRQTGLTAWYITPPLGSKINVQYDSSDSLDITPDMPGTYSVVMFHKKDGFCNLKVSQLTVTLNEEYDSKLSPEEKSILDKIGEQNYPHIKATNSNLAQELITGDKEVVIAVIDTGVNYNHPTLKTKMWVNKLEIPGDGIDNDKNGYIDDVVGYDFENADSMPMDDDGHGTHVAGLAAGVHLGSGGTENIKIMALKIGSSTGLDFGSIVRSIDYAVENEADIINMSLGSARPSRIMPQVLSSANDRDVLIVAAAGNGDHTGKGVNNDITPQYPASYNLPNIISVGAVEKDGSLTKYSNYGRNEVDITAPGGHSNSFDRRSNLLISAYIKNPSGFVLNPMAGTSMAAPLVAGISALAITEYSEITPAIIKTLLMRTGKKSPFLKDQIYSESVVDAHAAINLLQMELLKSKR